MPDVTYTFTTDFYNRMKAAVLAEKPELVGQSNAVINAAIKATGKREIQNYVHTREIGAAFSTARGSVPVPTDTDIT